MIVRALDAAGDWLFGKGKNDYFSSNNAVAQAIKTRLGSFLGDCFFDTQSGIDWFNLLGSKNQVALNLAISATILNTRDVTGIKELSFILNDNRLLQVKYRVQTTYSIIADTYQYDLNGSA